MNATPAIQIATDNASAADDICIGRQPILDRRQQTYGYELLFRDNSDSTEAGVTDQNAATARVLAHTFVDIGLQAVVGEDRAFINMPRDFITGDMGLSLNPRQVVIEVLEHVEPEPEVLEGLRRLREAGFTIALDDFVAREGLEELIALADIVKLDVLGQSQEAIARQVADLRTRGVPVLLAERVEERAMFEHCLALGFDLFQGYFFAKPHIVPGRQVPDNQLALMQLMSKAWQADVDLFELEELINRDVTLSYKLLRFINSAAFSLPQEIDSIHRAIVALGIRNLARWVSMLTIGSMQGTCGELTRLSLVRARMCEELALAAGEKAQAPVYFTAGLLSTLEALLGQTMEEILTALPLSDALNGALLAGEGELGEILGLVRDYELLLPSANEHPLAGRLPEIHLAAIAWTEETLKSLQSAA